MAHPSPPPHPLRIAALLAKAVKIEAAGPLPFGVHADHPALRG